MYFVYLTRKARIVHLAVTKQEQLLSSSIGKVPVLKTVGRSFPEYFMYS